MRPPFCGVKSIRLETAEGRTWEAERECNSELGQQLGVLGQETARVAGCERIQALAEGHCRAAAASIAQAATPTGRRAGRHRGRIRIIAYGIAVRASKGGSLAMRRFVNFVVSRHQAEIMYSNTGHAAAAPNPSLGSGVEVTEWSLRRFFWSADALIRVSRFSCLNARMKASAPSNECGRTPESGACCRPGETLAFCLLCVVLDSIFLL